MDATATILAVSSPPGRSARGLVRISGRDAFALMRLRLDPCPPDEGVPRSIIPARLQFGDADLPVLVLTAPGPATATGEDVVELQAPGNPHLLARIIDALIEVGTDAGLDVRLAEAGEFTARAFFNGRCSLTEAEGVAATIAACSDAQLQAASMLRTGRLGTMAMELSESIAGMLSLVEAGIDFTDEEDVVAIAPGALLERLAPVRERVREVLERSIGMELLQGPAPGRALWSTQCGKVHTVQCSARFQPCRPSLHHQERPVTCCANRSTSPVASGPRTRSCSSTLRDWMPWIRHH